MRIRTMAVGLILGFVLLGTATVPMGCSGGDDKNAKDPVDLKIEEGDSFDPTKEKSK